MLTHVQRRAVLERMRDARALVLRDAESFGEASSSLEYCGQLHLGRIRGGLKDYEECLAQLLTGSGMLDHEEAMRRLTVVREARNGAVHDGAYARHLGSKLVEILLLLEEALLAKDRPELLAEDLMVRNPLIAESWQRVADMRRTMLANAFSSLPILVGTESEGAWHLVTDVLLSKLLWGRSGEPRKATLAKSIADLTKSGDLILAEAECVPASMPAKNVVPLLGERGLPVLVTDDTAKPPRLLGMLSASDFL